MVSLIKNQNKLVTADYIVFIKLKKVKERVDTHYSHTSSSDLSDHDFKLWLNPQGVIFLSWGIAFYI